MKRLFLPLIALCMAFTAMGESQTRLTPQVAWDSIYPLVQAQIKAPEFRNKDYRLLDYGKKSSTPGFLYLSLIHI